MESLLVPSFCPFSTSLLLAVALISPFSIAVKFSLVSHLTCPRLHYLPLCSVWNNGPSISPSLLQLCLCVYSSLVPPPIYSLHCLYAHTLL